MYLNRNYTAHQCTPLSSCTSNKNSLNSSSLDSSKINKDSLPKNNSPASRAGKIPACPEDLPEKKEKKPEEKAVNSEKKKIEDSSGVAVKTRAGAVHNKEVFSTKDPYDEPKTEKVVKSEVSKTKKLNTVEKKKVEVVNSSEIKNEERKGYSTEDAYTLERNDEKYYKKGFSSIKESPGARVHRLMHEKIKKGDDLNCKEAAAYFQERHEIEGLGSYWTSPKQLTKLKNALLDEQLGTLKILKAMDYYIRNFEAIHKKYHIDASEPCIDIMFGYLSKFLPDALGERRKKKKEVYDNSGVPEEFREVLNAGGTWK